MNKAQPIDLERSFLLEFAEKICKETQEWPEWTRTLISKRRKLEKVNKNDVK